jgi:hypothetical protein
MAQNYWQLLSVRHCNVHLTIRRCRRSHVMDHSWTVVFCTGLLEKPFSEQIDHQLVAILVDPLRIEETNHRCSLLAQSQTELYVPSLAGMLHFGNFRGYHQQDLKQ